MSFMRCYGIHVEKKSSYRNKRRFNITHRENVRMRGYVHSYVLKNRHIKVSEHKSVKKEML